MQPFISQRRDVATSSGLNQRDFFRYNKKNEKPRRGDEIQDRDNYTSVDREIVCTPVFVFYFFLKHLMINNSMIVKNNMMF